MSVDGLAPVRRGPGSPPPGNGETHVWVFSLDVGHPVLEALHALLSPDEIGRAERLRDPRERARFVAGRGQLRQVIGDCLGQLPGSVRFKYSPLGKPSLADDAEAARLRFSPSGSDALGVVAVRGDAEIGVDVERVHAIPDIAALARRMLGADEHKEYAKIPKSRRETRFFEYWVRKEASAKALGSGLRQGFHRLKIHPWPGDGPFQVDCVSDETRATTWVVGVPMPVAGYTAALAATQPIGPVLTAWWDPLAPD